MLLLKRLNEESPVRQEINITQEDFSPLTSTIEQTLNNSSLPINNETIAPPPKDIPENKTSFKHVIFHFEYSIKRNSFL